MKKILSIFIAIAISMFLFACNTIPKAGVTITVLHVNDTHSHVESKNADLILGGEKTRVRLGGFSKLITLIREEEQKSINPVLLHAGDAITGTIYYTLFGGKSDAELLNFIDWDAFVLGNHEFDYGNEGLKNFLDILATPTIAANVEASKDSILYDYWKPYKIIEVEGQPIGIIGLDIVGKTKNSSNPGDDITFYEEEATVAKYVKELESKKINKILVLAHIGHNNAISLAQNVSGIDVIINGDSHSLQGDDNITALGLNPIDSYPSMQTSPKGEPVVIVQAWEYTNILGKLQVTFDADGIVASTEGEPVLLVSDSFKRKNSEGTRVELEGADRDAVYADIEANSGISIVEEHAESLEIIARYQEQKDKLGKEVIAEIAEDIPGGSSARIPKEGKGGHFTAQLVADGMLHVLRSNGTGQVDG